MVCSVPGHGHFLPTGLEIVTRDWHSNLTDVPTLKQIVDQERLKGSKGSAWAVLKSTGK